MENSNLFEKSNRRVFIKGLGFISLGLYSTLFFGGCEGLIDKIKNRPIRRRLRVGSPEVDADINTYKQAVTLMQGLPSVDPRNWVKQAYLHGNPSGFTFCQHGTQHFFSWHRAYLFYFEKICQQLTGNDKFGLPYWNWNKNPDIHPEYLDTTSVLYESRNLTSVSSVSSVSDSFLDIIFSDGNFHTFDDQIEGSPHNNVHSNLGQKMGDYDSPIDPLFWNHHCMVDYCWYKWNVDMENDNPNDSGWINTEWTHFSDADGNPTSMTAGITTLMPLLSYQYESSGIGSSTAALMLATKAEYDKVEKRIKKGANVKFDIKRRVRIAETESMSIGNPFNKEAIADASEFSAIINADRSEDKIFVQIKYAHLPETSDFFVRVFINLPSATRNTSEDDVHYAGSFAFFGTRMKEDENSPEKHSHHPQFLVNITNTLQKLKERDELTDGQPITVQLVLVPLIEEIEKEKTELLLQGIDIIVTPVITKGG